MEQDDLSESDIAEKNKYKKGSFFGVYMLHCLNPKYKSKVYIGFTMNPKRRLMQHNKGKWAGGAKKTSCKGPWEMVVIVHQFPNKISALSFEWAWQHPDKSRRMRNFEPRRFRESQFNYYCRALQELLSVGPWNKLPLEISWLNYDYMKNIIDHIPKHMPCDVNTAAFDINTGKRQELQVSVLILRKSLFFDNSTILCSLCTNLVLSREKIICKNDNCLGMFHIRCLAMHFTIGDSLLPVEGNCPSCNERVLWGDLVRLREDIIRESDMSRYFTD